MVTRNLGDRVREFNAVQPDERGLRHVRYFARQTGFQVLLVPNADRNDGGEESVVIGIGAGSS